MTDAADLLGERYIVSMDEAAEVRRKTIACRKGPCDKCGHVGFDQACFMAPEQLRDWEQDPCCNAYFKRCGECQEIKYPWAPKLDVERVRAWMQNLYDGEHGASAFLLSRLEELTK